jgi:hypothetical protein
MEAGHMTRFSAIVGGLLALVVCGVLFTQASAQTAPPWTTLFDGRNLDAFNPVGTANWKIADGVVQAAGYGVVAGFATMLANAAGPVMNAYLLAKRLPKEEFIATGAWFFLIINLSKVPVYAGRGLMSAHSLLFDLLLAPAVVVGALCGRQIFARIPQRAFERIVLLLTGAAAVLLVS